MGKNQIPGSRAECTKSERGLMWNVWPEVLVNARHWEGSSGNGELGSIWRSEFEGREHRIQWRGKTGAGKSGVFTGTRRQMVLTPQQATKGMKENCV